MDLKQKMLSIRLYNALIQQAITRKPFGRGSSFPEGDLLTKDGDNYLYDVGDSFVVHNTVTGNWWILPCKSPQESTTLREVKIFFDGASKGNPGPSGAGWIVSVDGNILEGSEALGIKTNNQAEYLALIRALQETSKQLANEPASILIHGDSQLVIRQLSGRYQVRSSRLLPLYNQVMELLRRFDSWHCQWVNRAKNHRADKLSKTAICNKGH